MANERILVVDDEPDIRELVSDILADEGFQVMAAKDAASAREQLLQGEVDLILLDIWMPDVDGISLLQEWKESAAVSCPVVMMSGHGTVETAVEATKLGAYGFIEKPLTTAKLLSTIDEALTSAASGNGQFVKELAPEIVGTSKVMQDLLEQYNHIAQTNSWVVLTGEPGSGRMLGARYIHHLCTNSMGSFVSVAAPEFEQMLSEESKSTIAKQLKILVQNAHGGSLFFQGLNELPHNLLKLALQVLKSLRVNQDQAPSAVRVMCSVAKPKEASALYDTVYSVLHSDCLMVEIEVPPLREHGEDIPELLHHYVDHWCAVENLPYRKFTIAAQNRLLHYQWPGNVNELRAMVQTMLLAGGDDISLSEIEDLLKRASNRPAANSQPMLEDLFDLPLREAREAFEKAYLVKQLKISGGSVSKLAERVGMERTHLYRKLRSLGIGSKDSA